MSVSDIVVRLTNLQDADVIAGFVHDPSAVPQRWGILVGRELHWFTSREARAFLFGMQLIVDRAGEAG